MLILGQKGANLDQTSTPSDGPYSYGPNKQAPPFIFLGILSDPPAPYFDPPVYFFWDLGFSTSFICALNMLKWAYFDVFRCFRAKMA